MDNKELKEWFARMDERQMTVIKRLDRIDDKLDRFEEKLNETDDRSIEALAIAKDVKDENKTAKRVAWGAVSAVLFQFLTGGK